jgi:hypothetical protein
VHKYKNIVSNNKTHAVSVEEKEKCWKRITEEFNSESPNGILRTQETLRRLFVNVVQTTRKIAAVERRDHYKTGGGTKQSITKDINYELVLDIIKKCCYTV